MKNEKIMTFPAGRRAHVTGSKLIVSRAATSVAVIGYLTLILAATGFELTWALMCLLAAIPVIGLAGWYFYRIAQLNRRIEASIGPVWDIIIGGVPAGTIKDAEYAAIKLRCLNNPSLVSAQLGSFVTPILSILATVWRAVPVWLFWILVVSALVVPEQAVSVVREMGSASPDELHALLAALLKTVTVFVFISVGFVRVFRKEEASEVGGVVDQAVAAELRAHCGNTSDATVTVWCWQHGSLHIDDVKTSFGRPPKAPK